MSGREADPFVVVGLYTNTNKMRLPVAVCVWDEMQAHDVAEAFIALSARTFLIGPADEFGASIEEYGCEEGTKP